MELNLNESLQLQVAITDISRILDASTDEVIIALRDNGLLSEEEAGEISFAMVGS